MVHLTACKYYGKKAFKVHNFLFPIIIIIINIIIKIMLSSVQLLSRVQFFVTPGLQEPGLPVHHQLSEFTQTHVYWVGDAIQPSQSLSSHPLLLPPSIFPSIRVFLNESVLRITWPKNWSFSFSISPSNEYSGLISFRMDWLDLLSVQGTLKFSSTPQFKSINSLVLNFLYSPTLTYIHDSWKTIALTRWTFVGKVMPLLFNMLSRLVIAFLPRSKCLLISCCSHHLQWFWSPPK